MAFATGSTAHVVLLGLLIAGIAIPGLLLRLLPSWLAWTGLVIAAAAELCTLSLVWSPLAVMLPVARFPGLIWLITAGALLPSPASSRDSDNNDVKLLPTPGRLDAPEAGR